MTSIEYAHNEDRAERMRALVSETRHPKHRADEPVVYAHDGFECGAL